MTIYFLPRLYAHLLREDYDPPRLSGLPPFEQCERVSGQNKHVVIHHPHPHHPLYPCYPHCPHHPQPPLLHSSSSPLCKVWTSVSLGQTCCCLPLTKRNNGLMSGDIKTLKKQFLEISYDEDLVEIWQRELMDGHQKLKTVVHHHCSVHCIIVVPSSTNSPADCTLRSAQHNII